jgi:hypothetical protein
LKFVIDTYRGITMKICPHCGSQSFDEEIGRCTKCGITSCGASSLASEGLPDVPPSPEVDHYTVPLSVSVSDAHVILFNWLEKLQGEAYKRDHFHILRMNKKYYGFWLFWFLVPSELSLSGEDRTADATAERDTASEQGKKKKIIVIPGAEYPAEVINLTSSYDFMELSLLEQKILSSPDYMTISRSEKSAHEEALNLLRSEEPALFDEKSALHPGISLCNRIPIGLPVWEGAYNFRGGKECPFYINGQKGKLVGEEFSKDSQRDMSKVLPYSLAALGALLLFILLFLLCRGGNQPVPTPSETIAHSSTPAPAVSAEPTASPSVALSPSPLSSPSIEITPSLSPSSSPSASTSPSPSATGAGSEEDLQQPLRVVTENFKAINDKDFQKVHDLRTKEIQESKSAAYYRGVYSENDSIVVLDARVAERDGDNAKVDVTIFSKDTIGGKKRQGRYGGWFSLKKEYGEWRIQDSQIKLLPGTSEDVP